MDMGRLEKKKGYDRAGDKFSNNLKPILVESNLL